MPMCHRLPIVLTIYNDAKDRKRKCCCRFTSWLLHNLPHRADETQQGPNSCPGLQILAFSLESIVSLPRSAFYVALFTILTIYARRHCASAHRFRFIALSIIPTFLWQFCIFAHLWLCVTLVWLCQCHWCHSNFQLIILTRITHHCHRDYRTDEQCSKLH